MVITLSPSIAHCSEGLQVYNIYENLPHTLFHWTFPSVSMTSPWQGIILSHLAALIGANSFFNKLCSPISLVPISSTRSHSLLILCNSTSHTGMHLASRTQ